LIFSSSLTESCCLKKLISPSLLYFSSSYNRFKCSRSALIRIISSAAVVVVVVAAVVVAVVVDDAVFEVSEGGAVAIVRVREG